MIYHQMINGGLTSARVDDVIGTVYFYADILRHTHCVKLDVNLISLAYVFSKHSYSMLPTHFYYSDVSKNNYHIKILSCPNENILRWNVMVTASSKPIKRAMAAYRVSACINTPVTTAAISVAVWEWMGASTCSELSPMSGGLMMALRTNASVKYRLTFLCT